MTDASQLVAPAVSPTKTRLAWKRRLIVFVAICGVSVVLIFACGWAYLRHLYPYGYGHSCDKQLMAEMLNYADLHEGWFPKAKAGGPAASLTLLHRDNPNVGAEILRGKTAPYDVVQAKLDRGEYLMEKDVGCWEYVEGLHKNDDGRLALFWDKLGLGHSGERQTPPEHIVWFVSGSKESITEDQWPQFLAEQERLRAEVFTQRTAAKPTE
ncbi:MAG: hypothetical protein NT013_17820 [Planctomycetia bacterium]|nr:hypothetical protein [Planctomycetia bacterium]